MTTATIAAVTVPAITDVKFHVWAYIPGTLGKSVCVGSEAAGTCDGCGKVE